MTTTERAAASDISFPLCSFLPFQTASQTCGLGFIANLLQPLSLGCAEPASLPPFVPSGHFPLIGGIGPWEGSQVSAPPEILRIG